MKIFEALLGLVFATLILPACTTMEKSSSASASQTGSSRGLASATDDCSNTLGQMIAYKNYEGPKSQYANDMSRICPGAVIYQPAWVTHDPSTCSLPVEQGMAPNPYCVSTKDCTTTCGQMAAYKNYHGPVSQYANDMKRICPGAVIYQPAWVTHDPSTCSLTVEQGMAPNPYCASK